MAASKTAFSAEYRVIYGILGGNACAQTVSVSVSKKFDSYCGLNNVPVTSEATIVDRSNARSKHHFHGVAGQRRESSI